MKKFIAIAMVLVLTMCLFAGCRGRQDDTTDGNTNTPNTNEGNMLPDGGDTIDPTNGANQDTTTNEATQDTDASEVAPSDGTNDSTNEGSGNTRSRIFPQR